MRNWFSRHPIWFMAFYLVFYLSVFHWLEVNITVPEVCHLPLPNLPGKSF